MKPPMMRGAPDDFQTPPYALHPLIPYIPAEWVVWEPACGHGFLVDELERLNYKVLATDLHANPSMDFLTQQIWDSWDVIITNPPYSIKQQFLTRCYELGKPFALLLPLTTFETAKRQALFKKHGVEVIFMDKRVNFQTPNKVKSSAWFATAWFTWGLNIGRAMTFTSIMRS